VVQINTQDFPEYYSDVKGKLLS